MNYKTQRRRFMEIQNFQIYSEQKQLQGRHYKANLENNKKKTILMCHGFAGIQDLFFPQYAEVFAKEGFDVVTFDYNGFGESEGNSEIIPSNQMLDILNILLFIKRKEDLQENKIILWGTSLGGLYALKIASFQKDIAAVYAQITFSNGLRNNSIALDEEGKEKYITQLENMKYKEIMENKKLLLPLKRLLSDEQSKNFLERYKEVFPELMNTKLALTTVKYINELSVDTELATISVPVLLAKATQDCVNAPSEMDFIFQHLSGEKKLLEFDCGHYDIYEAEPFEKGIQEQIEWFTKI